MAMVTIFIGLLFASETLARPLTEPDSCVEVPRLEILKPKKDGTIRDCAWLANSKRKKQNRICSKLERQNRPTCPITCNTCDPFDSECPASFGSGDLVEGGDCSSYKPGLSCNANYKYINGCGGTDSITCAAIDTYTCDNGAWAKSSFVDLPCVGDRVPPSGQECDPAECPFNAPEPRTNCGAAQVGLSCPYDYRYVGCNFEDGYMCTAMEHHICTEEQIWVSAFLDPLPCPDPVKGSPAGQTCEPCPTEPAEECPLTKPTHGNKCSIDFRLGVECQYDFDITGCSADKLQCTAGESFFCNKNGKWDHLFTIPEPCGV